MGLAIVGVLIQTGTLSLRGLVNQQAWVAWKSFATQWLWLPAIGAFIIFLIAAFAGTNHPPFDFSEAEEELARGYHAEYTGIRFAIFYLAEFMNVITMSAIAVSLFLGGPSGPRFGLTGWIAVWILPVFWFMLKLWIVLSVPPWVPPPLPPPPSPPP